MKEFQLGEVLSVTTGVFLSESGMDGLYRILNHMTGDNLFTHQLPRAAELCAPKILEMYPELENVSTDTVNENNALEWLSEQKSKFGNTFEIPKLEEYTYVNPITELIEMRS